MKIPATATIVYGPTEVETPIEYLPGQGEKLSEHLAKRMTEVEDERKFLLKADIPRLPLFGKVIDGIRPDQKIVFGSKDHAGYAVYSFLPVGKDLFIQYVDSILPEEDIVSTINAVASHLRSRAEDEIPAEPGSCIEGGFIPLEQAYERATIGIRLKEFPDLHLSVDVHKNQDYLPEDLILLRERAQKTAEANGLGAVFASTKILRQQTRQLSNWNGKELALRIPAYKNDTSVHEFRFHAMGAVHDSLNPELDIRFDSGVKGNRKASVKPSLTDEEALALWDKLITTIRLRQPSDATPAKTTASRVPLASLVRTGETCPQTGWWECTEGKGIEGNRQRLFKAGEPLPHALLASNPGLWRKLTGNRPMRQIATVWKLVRYDDEPACSTAG